MNTYISNDYNNNYMLVDNMIKPLIDHTSILFFVKYLF